MSDDVTVPRELVERLLRVLEDDEPVTGDAWGATIADLRDCLPWEPDPEAVAGVESDLDAIYGKRQLGNRLWARKILRRRHAKGWHLTRLDLEHENHILRSTEDGDRLLVEVQRDMALAEVQRLRDGIRDVLAAIKASDGRTNWVRCLAALLDQEDDRG